MAQYFNYQDQTVSVGDTVVVSQEIVEGNKKRIQAFEGIVIAIQNASNSKSFVVRKIGAGAIGVEKIFPLNLPTIKKIEIKRQGKVRRAKLYYLREKVGRSATRIKAKNLFTKTAPAA